MKVLGMERKVVGQHHATAVLYEHRSIAVMMIMMFNLHDIYWLLEAIWRKCFFSIDSRWFFQRCHLEHPCRRHWADHWWLRRHRHSKVGPVSIVASLDSQIGICHYQVSLLLAKSSSSSSSSPSSSPSSPSSSPSSPWLFASRYSTLSSSRNLRSYRRFGRMFRRGSPHPRTLLANLQSSDQ